VQSSTFKSHKRLLWIVWYIVLLLPKQTCAIRSLPFNDDVFSVHVCCFLYFEQYFSCNVMVSFIGYRKELAHFLLYMWHPSCCYCYKPGTNSWMKKGPDCDYDRYNTRRVWRYQRGNPNPYIEEEQTTQWPKEKVQKDKQRSTKHTHKSKDRVTRTPLKNRGWTEVLRKGKLFLLH
jgi:hypothetical protein